MAHSVAVLGTLDSKGPEYHYLLTRLQKQGLRTILIDISCLSETGHLSPEFTCREVAKRGGGDFSALAGMNKIEASRIMIDGAISICQELIAKGLVSGIIAMGGANGTNMAGTVMKTLPLFFPKVIVSVLAACDPRASVGTKDIVLINAVTDISLNTISQAVLDNAVAALWGMLELGTGPAQVRHKKSLVAATMLGLTQNLVQGVKDLIETADREVVVFHTNGTGGEALERFISDGLVDGVLDLTINELINWQLGGVFNAGPNRLEAALSRRLPMIIVPGCLDFVNFWGMSIPGKFGSRSFIFHNQQNTLMRTLPTETYASGLAVGEKLNRTQSRVQIIVPALGVSGNDKINGPLGQSLDGSTEESWYKPEAITSFVDGLNERLRNPLVEVTVLPHHLGDQAFIAFVANAYLTLTKS